MAILKIARMGHPVLNQVAAPVADPPAPEIQRLLNDMTETLADADGAGLAAPQVHVPLRVVLVRVPRERLAAEGEEAPQEVPLTAMINPAIAPLTDARELGWEACLSVPGLAGFVPRFTHIEYRYQTADGIWHEQEAKGFHARVVQHECDHLDGILYPMRMEDLSRLGFVKELQDGQRSQQEEKENADAEG